MTNRRKPAQRTTSTAWKPSRPRSELLKAIGGAGGVLLLSALVIFVIKPGDTSTTPSTGVPVTTQTQPVVSTPTQPAASTTTPTQP